MTLPAATRRIVLVDNVSVEPFRLVPPTFDATVRDEAPTRAWTRALEDAVDLAVIPVARLRDVAPVFEPLGEFGVACRGPVGSVLLFGEAPVADLVRGGAPIHLTTRSETSRRLLGLLCLREFGRAPAFAPDLAGAQARLCIGDEALRRRLDPGGWPVVADLGEWWHRQTGLGFVFARWMVRRTAPADFKRDALQWLDRCVQTAATPDGRRAMAGRAVQAGLFADEAAASGYFAGLRSRFDDADRRGEQAFLRQLEAAAADRRLGVPGSA